MDPQDMAPLRPEEWLIGALGVWMGTPAQGWRRLGPFTYVTNGIHISWSNEGTSRLLVAGGHGLWETTGDPHHRWVQLHDETLTEVMAVRDTQEGVVAASSYGVCVASLDDLGLPRWRSQTEERVPDERFTNTLQIGEDGLRLVGTEAGVLVSEDDGQSWRLSDLQGSAVRALCRVGEGWLAGTDTRGLWASQDGLSWKQAPSPTTAVFSIYSGSHLLLGGYDGIYAWQDGDSNWRRVGPRALIRALAVADGIWLAGADPGGLWVSEDEGVSWQRTGDFGAVNCICPAKGS